VTVSFAGLALASPVMIASGCGGTGRELTAYTDLSTLGGFVTRSITLDPREGGPVPRVVETPSGFVHAVGLHNPGLDGFLMSELPWLAQHKVRTFVSVAGAALGEYAELARRLGRAPGLSGIEVNLADPESARLGLFDAREPFQAARVVSTIRRELPRGLPVLAKLGCDPTRVVEAARTVVEAGADAVVLGTSLPALMPDGRVGGLSGPAVRPVALRCVYDVHSALPELLLVGAGGITCAADARAYLAAGATAVQIGSGLLHDPTCAARTAAELHLPEGEER
jgi:dihydroorotate dehydrogenase (NAD+) catalytic subunit